MDKEKQCSRRVPGEGSDSIGQLRPARNADVGELKQVTT